MSDLENILPGTPHLPKGIADRKAAEIHSQARRRRLSNMWHDGIFLIPGLSLFAIFVVYPNLSNFYYSLTNWNGINPPQFVGFANFIRLLHDPTVWTDIRNTLYYTIVVAIVQNVTGLLLALACNGPRRINGVLRVLFLIPALISPLGVGILWEFIYSPNFGAINIFLSQHHWISFIHDWLGDPHLAMNSIIVAIIWQFSGFIMVIYLAGLKGIPPDLNESASLDGASPWQRFRYVTLPLLAPAFTITIALSIIGGLKVFDIIYIMTQGGPARATETLGVRIYQEGIANLSAGYATAISLMLFALILVASIPAIRQLRKREVEA